MAYGRRTRRSTKRTRSTTRRTTRHYSRKGTAVAYRALRIARSATRRVAGEVCKFESTPDSFSNALVTYTSPNYTGTRQTPLLTITSGEPWIMPLNWTYGVDSDFSTSTFYVNGIQLTDGDLPDTDVSIKNPIWYNTMFTTTGANGGNNLSSSQGTELQYRLKYLYINALFNAAEGNPDGAVRFVIVKDRQPTGGAATWYDANISTNSRGVFNAQRIDAQLNPNTVGRFKIMYDKTLRFTTINSYKPFKYFKKMSTVVRNNRNILNTSTFPIIQTDIGLQTSNESPPVQRNAYYLMIFSDGLDFTYTNDSTTANGTFHLFNRVAYYNN